MTKTNLNPRVIGLDGHPDTFTAAALRGPIPASAVVEQVFNRIPISRLAPWAQKNTGPEDTIVLEASGNSFQIARTLIGLGRKALVLDSRQMGKLKEVHANNDKISAVRIGRAYLAGTAKIVWLPDPNTQERRDWWHAYYKAVKRSTQVRNSIGSYLSDNGVRIPKGLRLATGGADIEQRLRGAKQWSPRQWLVLEGLLMALRHAEEQRKHWRSLIAQEVATDPALLQLVRLCGVRDIIAFAIGAIVGDVSRFARPKSLVKYVGLNPAFDDSGEGQWHGGIGGHGRRDLRCLLIQAAHALIRTAHPLAKWGRKLLMSRGSKNLAVAAIARKLVVAIWYVMNGKCTTIDEIDAQLAVKVDKILSVVGRKGLQALGRTRSDLRRQMYHSFKTYVLDLEQKTPART